MKKNLVIFHGNCIDGFTAAWAAWRHFGDDDTEYLPAEYGHAVPGDIAGRDVYIVDFSYKRDLLLLLKQYASSILILDHHKTAQEDLKDLPYARFDMERSGAGMTWDYFHGAESRPWLIDYVEDRDLWRFKLPGSKEVNAWVGAQKRTDFAGWTRLMEEGLGSAGASGAAVMQYVERYVEEMAAQAREVYTDHSPLPIPMVNAPYINTSELVGRLAERAPFAIGWFQRKDGLYQYSLRSRGDSGTDVSDIAKKYGGGGHKNAAGFTSETQVW